MMNCYYYVPLLVSRLDVSVRLRHLLQGVFDTKMAEEKKAKAAAAKKEGAKAKSAEGAKKGKSDSKTDAKKSPAPAGDSKK